VGFPASDPCDDGCGQGLGVGDGGDAVELGEGVADPALESVADRVAGSLGDE
jgi:hypothetical protein